MGAPKKPKTDQHRYKIVVYLDADDAIDACDEMQMAMMVMCGCRNPVATYPVRSIGYQAELADLRAGVEGSHEAPQP